MARDLLLRVGLTALDRASRPLRAIANSSVGLGRSLKDTRAELKGLQGQQRDVSSFRTLKGEAEKTGSALQASRDKVRQLSGEMQAHKRVIAPLQSSYDALSSQSEQLSQDHKDLTRQLRQTRQEASSANQTWQANRQRIRELGQQIGSTAAPTKKLRDEYEGLITKQQEQLALVKGLTERQKALNQQHKLSATNTRQHKEKLADLASQLREAQAPMVSLNSAFREGVRDATKLKQKHSEQQRELQGLRGKLSAAGISTRNLGEHERELRSKISATNQALTQQENRLKRVTAQQKALANAKEQYESSQDLAGSMAGSGAAGLATGSGILYAGAQMMAPGLQFDADMSKVQALTRLQGDDAQLAAMRAQARQLGADTMFSATDAAQGQGYLAMAGFDPKAIMAAMPGMLSLAKAGDSGLAETADIAANILKGMNLQAGEAGRVGDVLVGTFTRSNTNLQMLGETMKYVGPVAASAGQDIETVAAMAGKLGDDGIKGSMGGTALRAIIGRLSSPTGGAAKALDKLGVSAKDSQGNLRDLPTVLQEIYEKTKGMGNADRAGLLKAIAGDEAVAGMQSLVKYAGSGELQKFVGTLRQTNGEANRTANIMGDNLKGDLDQLSSAWEDLGIQLQEQQNGPLREITQSLASVVGGVKSWIVENPGLASALVKTAAGVGILMAGMGGLTLAMASLLGPFAMVRYGMMLFGIRGAGLASTLFSLGRTALPLVGKGILFIGRALMMNPIGLAITAIAAGAYLIYKNWDRVGPYFLGLWAEIKQGFSGGLGGIAATLLNFSPLGLFYRAFAGVMGYLGVELPGKFTEFGGMIMQGLVNGIKNAAGAVKGAVVGAADSSINYFKEKLGIHSPSRVFAQLGDFTMQGLAQGLSGGEGGPMQALTGIGKRLTQAGAIALSATVGSGAIAMDNRPPLSAASTSQAVASAAPNFTIHVHPSAGMDEQALARLVGMEVDKRMRAIQISKRSSLSDQE